MPKSSVTYSISDLSKEFDITTRTIRFYEEKGLLNPRRDSENGTARRYSNTDRVKLKLILRGKRLGFSLDETGDMIDMYDPARGNLEQLTTMIAKIEQRLIQLDQQRHDLELTILELTEARERCLRVLESR